MAERRRMNADARSWVKQAVGTDAESLVVSKLEAAGCITVEHLEAADRDALVAAELVSFDINAILKYQKQAGPTADLAQLREELRAARDELREAALREDELREATHRVIPQKQLDQVQKSCFVVYSSKEDDAKPIGVGVFFAPLTAVTAAHVLTTHASTESNCSQSVWVQLHGHAREELTVEHMDEPLDYAILRSTRVHDHLECWTGCWDPQEVSRLTGEIAVLCSFQAALEQHLHEFEFGKVGVVRAEIIRTSKRHVAYTSNTFEGDSGSALVLLSGKLLGIHLDGVNAIKESLRQAGNLEDEEDELTSVHESLASIAGNTGHGGVGILCSAFAKALHATT